MMKDKCSDMHAYYVQLIRICTSRLMSFTLGLNLPGLISFAHASEASFVGDPDQATESDRDWPH